MNPKYLLAIAALFTSAHAFKGEMRAGDYWTDGASPNWASQTIYLKDDLTGSTYEGKLLGGFNWCITRECKVRFARWAVRGSFHETSEGGYQFTANMWKTNDGCHNIDFLGALDANHGYCCGSLPCQFTA
ncbi:hypothetical protein BJX63DRAFT_436447 [Aspergillus granulosus]|uniref:Uncharacterized protein n=1 Tax=Aspergillus granulosus TaxID=176169 RepID=A0ABR4GXZ6_9EURO